MKQKLFTFFLALIASVSAIYASDIEVDGIWYDFDSSTKTASVTYRGSSSSSYEGEYSGSVTIPETVTYNGTTYSVTSIGNYAFQKCSSLTSVTIPNSVTSIGDWAFFYCSSLTSVTIPNSVTSIGDSAFEGCSSLTSITIPESVTSIGESAFGLCESLTSITIPNSVTSIEMWTFLACSSLTSVTIGNSVEDIGYQAFASCSSLSSITIPNSVTSIGDWAFSDCSSLTSPVYNAHCFAYMPTSYSGAYTIPEGIEQIAGGAFSDCSSLTSVTIPNSVTSIGKYAFEGCSSLTSITIPNSVTSIGNSAFYDCSSLTSVTIPNSVTSIGDHAFSGCSSLISITIPNSVTSIGKYAFEGCSSLTSVTIPESVTSIGYRAFKGCSSLTSVTLNSNTIVNKTYNYNSTDNLSNIFNTQITEFIIGNNVKGVGDYAFYGCSSLTSVTIGESVTSIGYSAFNGCSKLTSITCEAETPATVGQYAFDGVSKSVPVYVPCGCIKAYKAASGWKDFTNIQEPLAEYSIEVYVNDTIMGTAKVDYNTFCEGAQISASPNIGYHFVQWSDGNTENPRTLELTQDTTLTAEFAQSFSGQCGDSLYWELVDDTLHITGSGEMYNYNPDTAPWKQLVSSSKTLTIAEDVTMIGNDAFDGCTALESIVWNAVKEVKQGITIKAKMPNHWYSQITAWVWTTASDGHVVYPTYENGWYVVTVNTPTINIIFRNGTGWTGDSNQTVDLFYNENVYLELQQSGNKKATAQVKNHLGAPFFDIRSQIKSFTFGDAVERIPAYLCCGMDKLTSMTIPNSVTSIGKSAFEGCSSLTSVTIPESVTSIGESTFYGCSKLTSVTIPNSVTSIGDMAFYECSSLTSVTIPNSVTSIRNSAFYGCSSLTSITIPNSVTSIRNSAFYGCSSLTSITIPNSVTSIGDAAFSSCNNITSVTWNAKNCNTYNFGSQVTSFEFGNEVEVVPSSLCEGMEKLTSVTIPNSVKTIDSSAFEGCARLSKISFGTGLEEIAANAFAGCTRLYDIYVYATYPPFAEESSFANYNVYVYVPCEYQRGYTLDVVWGKFKFIECIESEDATTDGNVTVVPGFNDVTITWPTAENADTYSLVINKDNQPFCTLTFNQDGQLLNIAFAPSRDGNNHPAQYAAQTVSGYRFTVTGLNEATQYVYNITTKDADNNTIATYSGEFTTMGGSTSAVEDILQNTTNVQKLLRNGQLIIVRDGVEYTIMGQEL